MKIKNYFMQPEDIIRERIKSIKGDYISFLDNYYNYIHDFNNDSSMYEYKFQSIARDRFDTFMKSLLKKTIDFTSIDDIFVETMSEELCSYSEEFEALENHLSDMPNEEINNLIRAELEYCLEECSTEIRKSSIGMNLNQLNDKLIGLNVQLESFNEENADHTIRTLKKINEERDIEIEQLRKKLKDMGVVGYDN